MKIVQLVTQRQARGAEIAAASLSEGLERLGHQIFFISLYPAARENVLEVNCHEILDLGGKKERFIDFSLLWSLRKVLKKIDPDIVQANGSDTFKYAVMALCFNFSTPLVYRNISMMSHWVKGRKGVKHLYRLLSKRLTHITSVSNSANADILKLLQYTSANSSVIKRGVKVNPVKKQSAKEWLFQNFGVNINSKLIVQVGHLSPEKNHSMAIDVFDYIKETHQEGVLLIVGSGPEENRLNALIASKGLEGRVILVGYQKQVDFFIAGAEVVTLTSLIEGIPGVALEAGVQSKPVVAMNVGGVSEVIKHEHNGYVVSLQEGVEGFVKYVGQLLEDQSIADRLGQAGKAMVESNHNIDNFIFQFESLYKQILKG